MTTILELQKLALEHFQAGRMEGVEHACQQILAATPNNADAHNLLGIALHQRGQSARAAQSIAQAVALNANHAGYRNNLGKVLLEQGRAAEAIDSFRAAIRLQPNLLQAHLHLGNALVANGQAAEAVAVLGPLLQAAGQSAELHYFLATALAAAGRTDEAIAGLQTAIQLDPRALVARNDLGVLLREAGRLQEAAEVLERAIQIDAARSDLRVNLANVYRDQERLDEAIASCREALRLTPNFAVAHNALGAALQVQGDLAGAEASYEQALAIDPRNIATLKNLAFLLLQSGQLAQAQATFERVLQLEPHHAEASYWCATIRLSQGDFAGSWAQYELRHEAKPSARPWWRGEALGGRRILVLPEGGLGDTLQFIRYAPLIEQRGGDVFVLVQDPLVPLLQESGFRQIVSSSTPVPECDVQVRMLSLPGIFGTTVETILPISRQLSASARLVDEWKHKLAAYAGCKIGIHWRGSRQSIIDTRSIPLIEFEPLSRVPGVTLFSLQKGAGTEELQHVAGRFSVVDLGEFDESHGPFMDTAAIMSNLDLVVTNDTVIEHVAGGLGVPAWVAMDLAPAWFWLQDREDTPWYPTVRLFRQQSPRRWTDVMQRIADELARWVADRTAEQSGGNES